MQVEAGPPELKSLSSDMSELARMVASAESHLENLEQELQQAQALSERQKARLEHLQVSTSEADANVAAVGQRLDMEVSALTKYVDDTVEPLARRYQLEQVQKQIEKMQADLHVDTAAAQERILFAVSQEPTSNNTGSTLKPFSQQVCHPTWTSTDYPICRKCN
jgi:chromosome segregation ATPase